MAAYVTSERAQRRAPFGAISLAAVALFSITACGKLGLGGSSDEMSWARAALERNDRIEVVAADPATSTFTVRIKETGDLRMVRADQVIAGPPGAPVSSTGMPAGPAAAPAGSATLSAMTLRKPPPLEQALRRLLTYGSIAGQPAGAPAHSQGAACASNAPPAGSQSMMRQSNAAASAPRTGYQSDPAPAAEVPNPNSDVASITPGGRALESGPGYAIKTASKASGNRDGARRARALVHDELGGRASARPDRLPGRSLSADRQSESRIRRRRRDGRGRLRDSHYQQPHHRQGRGYLRAVGERPYRQQPDRGRFRFDRRLRRCAGIRFVLEIQRHQPPRRQFGFPRSRRQCLELTALDCSRGSPQAMS